MSNERLGHASEDMSEDIAQWRALIPELEKQILSYREAKLDEEEGDLRRQYSEGSYMQQVYEDKLDEWSKIKSYKEKLENVLADLKNNKKKKRR